MASFKTLSVLMIAVLMEFLQVILFHTAEANNDTLTSTNFTVDGNSTAGGGMESKKGGKSENKAAVAIAITITVLALVGIVLAVFFIRRRRQSLMLDKEKKMQMQMSSARNAGVYQDLTVSVPADEKPPATPEHEKLNNTEEA